MPEDYVFQRAGADGTPTDVRLSALFAPGKGSLVIYSMMFPRYSSDERPGTECGQTALPPLAELRARRTPPSLISSTAPRSTPPSA